MTRIKSILVLLLATCLVAGSVLPSAANAVPTSGNTSGSTSTSTTTAAGGSGDEDDSGRGDPGGAGDGLGADLENPGANSVQSGGTSAAVEFLLQLLRLMEAAG